MRNAVRSLRQLRIAFQSQTCIFIGGRVSETPCHFENCYHIHSSAYRVVDHAEQPNFFKNHSVTTIIRALSVDAAKLTNRGFIYLFMLFFFGLNFSLCWNGENLKLIFPLI